MYPTQTAPTRAKRPAIEREEEKAWIRFYQQVHADPVLATEILAQLDSDAELRRRHSALYLCSRQALHAHQMRRTRNRQVAAAVRWMSRALLVIPVAALTRAVNRSWRRAGDVALALLPPSTVEPAQAKVDDLLRQGDVAAARMAFRERDAGTPAADDPQETTTAVAAATQREPQRAEGA